MTLNEWMLLTKTTNPALGQRLGTSAETVRRYRKGERFPSGDEQKAIFEATSGLVTPNDWVGVGPRTAVLGEDASTCATQ